jgi:hypothetical protein
VKVKAGSGAWTYRMKYTIVQSNEEKTSPKCVRRGLIELSTMSNGSTLLSTIPADRHQVGMPAHPGGPGVRFPVRQ